MTDLKWNRIAACRTHLLILMTLALAGCSGSDAPSIRGATGGAGSMGGSPTGGVGGFPGGAGQGIGGGVVGGASGLGGAAGSDECAFVSSEAKTELLPTDIVWAIDTSGSMFASFLAIQAALTTFSDQVTASGIDARIVLLAGSGFCVPAPLGSGNCGAAAAEGQTAPDSREPAFLHLDLPFGANLGMETLLNNHDSYKHLLRPGALTHLVITEDGVPPMSADLVVEHLEGRASATLSAPWTPALEPGRWVFHGVVCKDGFGIGTCFLSDAVPETTLQLIERTGGLVGNLNDAGSMTVDPFADLLTKLAEQVIVGARVSCEYTIPPPPSGGTLNPDEVNVAIVDGTGSTVLPRAASRDECAENLAWAYDNSAAPTRVELCPTACAAAQGKPDGRVEVRFGCETVVLVVE